MCKKENRLLTVAVCVLVTGLLLAGILLPDKVRSESERRTLAKFPAFRIENVLNGAWFDAFEDYLADQFPGREWFRKLKASAGYKVLRQLENNDYYVAEGQLGKLDASLNEAAVEQAGRKFEQTAELFPEATPYYTIIPDKNYYLAETNGYPDLDYGRMEEILGEALPAMKYISVFDRFEAKDYYTTDIHIRQESWMEGADALLEGMENPYRTTQTDFTTMEVEGFYGAWLGQAAVDLPEDTIRYLSSPAIEAASVYDFEAQADISVYDETAAEGLDKYDIYLSGARALLTITCPQAKSDRELILVRDSFGSSLAPLLTEGYQKITLVDLRYINVDLLPAYIRAGANCDLLFACSSRTLNSGNIFK